ncbi:hypothetical protein LV84_03914 [Algoriphagus ratkowskyi]|uniref:6-bladed beta-propeller protein n=1 Tax=Algoriphagus ratkowskyi TaxID=57028 RepID=A0A2W7SJ53_9BACT|nr:hypothetical protein [Algoriphagus ratkowskyi]PZX50722.1 hypothetical protein LV84_03914 [Algoriphagus ratkowskyi]TXD75789.1 hypothetical protein ESW18_19095 [Algoriphagus ratkowskyi]
MNKSTFVALTALLASILFSCSEKETTTIPTSPIQELQFEVYDSIMVDLLEPVTILDYHSSKDLYLMKNTREGKVFLVNGKGEILEKHELGGEGPNQIQQFYEGRFYGESGYVFKELSMEMPYHLFDTNFNKIKKTKGTVKEMMMLSINSNKQSFAVYEEDGKYKIVGEEPNSFSIADIDLETIGADFYNKVNSGFLLDLDQDSVHYLNVYPDDWTFKKEQKWIGATYPSLSFNPTTKTLASLPQMGYQLGIYKLEGNNAVYQTAVELSHPDRDGYEAVLGLDGLVYPGFNDIKAFGSYQILTFFTPMPEDILMGFKAKSEEYFRDPEFREALRKYRKPRYIIVKGDQQIGILNELPVAGVVNFGLPDGTLLIKAADGEVERDYNLFYKVRLVEE